MAIATSLKNGIPDVQIQSDGFWIQSGIVEDGIAGVQATFVTARQAEPLPQTWYYMSREGTPHGMVYDPVGGVIYEINQVPDQSVWEQIEGLIINSVPSNDVKVNISVGYQYSEVIKRLGINYGREKKKWVALFYFLQLR